MHGNLNYLRCVNCQKDFERQIFIAENNKISKLKILCPFCKSVLKPKLVLTEEKVENFHRACEEMYKSDLFLVIGVNLKIWPSNQIIYKAKEEKCKILYLDNSLETYFN